jgi:hypothetical protein
VASRRTATVEELVELWNSGDMDRFLESLAPDFEFTPDPSFPDAGVYRGDEVKGWMRDWAETWQDNELEILGSVEHRRAVILDCRWHLAAPQSGDEIPVSDFSMVLWSIAMGTICPRGWPPSSIASGHSRRPGLLADSPVNGCMLRSTRLGCLKKPTEEARGG